MSADALVLLDELDAARDLSRLEELDCECREATADAKRQTAGMREVALFRAANAKAVMGGYSLDLAKRNVRLTATVRAVLELIDPEAGMATGNGYDATRLFSERDIRTAITDALGGEA